MCNTGCVFKVMVKRGFSVLCVYAKNCLDHLYGKVKMDFLAYSKDDKKQKKVCK